MIGVIYNEPAPLGYAFSESSLDVLTQVEAVHEALDVLGHASVSIPFQRDVGRFIRTLQQEKVKLAFNLCETVDEDPRFAGHPAAVLELLGIPFSGSPAAAIMLTTDKHVTKGLLKASGTSTPRYLLYDGNGRFSPWALTYPVIVKPRFEDASIGIDQESIFEDEVGLSKGLPRLFDRFGTLLVEEFVHGREFNISLLGYPSAEVMPMAEIDFSELPADLYPIVGYRAKWDKDSFEYHHTPRTFPGDIPHALTRKMEYIAMACFRLFMLRDYARVDMRVDGRGEVHVLEVNANPCLSPDAGFAAAASKLGLSYTQLVGRLLDFVIHRGPEDEHQAPSL